MPYKTGGWGQQAQIRSKKRLKYFKEYFKSRYKKVKKDPNRILQKDLRKRIIEKLGHKCKKCGFNDIRALQIDHVDGGGLKELRSMSPWKYYKIVLEDITNKYQLLCANCNWIKKYENKEFRKKVR